MPELPAIKSIRDRLAALLRGSGDRIEADSSASRKRSRYRIVIACVGILLVAFCVRVLHWQDYFLYVGEEQSGLVSRYKQQAQRMLDREGILYPAGYREHSSVQLLVHPPGYSIFIAGLYELFGSSDNTVVLAQILSDSTVAVLIFLIAAELLRTAIGLIAGLIIAFSPHLAHHSLLLLPESLVVLPIVLAMWLIVRARKHPRLWMILTAGALIGVACWLRSNTLLLAPLIAVSMLALFERGKLFKYAGAFVCAAVLVILPITIRNWVVFKHFIPLSLGSGVTMIEGIADYDKENRFGMPATDDEAALKDVEWHNRPDYGTGLWRPDGIERDRYRFARGLDVIKSNPGWFAGVMVRRAATMLRYNDSASQGWPADTALISIVSAEPAFGHQLEAAGDPVWSQSASELLAAGRLLSPQTEGVVQNGGETLTIAGNDSEFGDQFASVPIALQKNTDYVLKVPFNLVQGKTALKVTSTDRRIALSSYIIKEQKPQPNRVSKKSSGAEEDKDEDGDLLKPASPGAADDSSMTVALLPFATGNRDSAVFVVSNNGTSNARTTVEIGRAEVFELGQTPGQWSRFVRPWVRGIQRNIYTTSHMLWLIGIGIVLIAAARQWKTLLILLMVPAYYLLVQSTLHTEYRYILPIHYFLFVAAAVILGLITVRIGDGSKFAFRRLRKTQKVAL